MKPVYSERVFNVHLDVEEVWEILSDTNTLNRAVGLPSVEYDEPNNPGKLITRKAKMKILFWNITWQEHPFDWIKNKFYSALRIYDNGPINRFWGGAQISPEPRQSGTTVKIFTFLEPRNIYWYPLVYIVVHIGTYRVKRYLGKHIRQRSSNMKPIPLVTNQSSANQKVLHHLIAEIAKEHPSYEEAVKHLEAHLKNAADENVVSMQPYLLADKWGLPRPTTLKTFLVATQKGLLNLEWVLNCPNCRIPKATFTSMTEITDAYHCDFCEVDYKASLDQATELQFSVASLVREASKDTFCIGNPANFPHIISQLTIPAGESREIPFSGMAQRMKVRAAKMPFKVLLDRDKSVTEKELRVELNIDGFNAETMKYPYPADFKLHITNKTSETVTFLLEHAVVEDVAVKALEVTLLEEFRRDFSSEVLAPNRNLGIEQITMMFTDLVASTAMYERLGDNRAYNLVACHFDYLEDIILKHNGLIVKTIGDAVMAAFQDPKAAVEAAFAMQSGFEKFLVISKIRESLKIKVGLHFGKTIAMSANHQMDFFGHTVNLAVRTLNASEGDDVVLTETLYNLPVIHEFVAHCGYTPDIRTTDLKGFDRPVNLYRIVPQKTQLTSKEVPSIKIAL